MYFTETEIDQLYYLSLQSINNSLNQEQLITKISNLRGGSDIEMVIAALGVILAIIVLTTNAWVTAPNAPRIPLPHLAWLYPDKKNHFMNNGRCLSHPPSRFEQETLDIMKHMCSASADENGCVMSYDQAYNLVNETYGGRSMQIAEGWKITDWQAAKKAYHFQKGFGIDLSQYPNISKEDLVELQNGPGGLIGYVQRGGKLTPIALIQEGQQKIYEFFHLENTQINLDATHYGNKGETPCIMYFNRETNQVAVFNKTSGDLITERLRNM